MRLELKFQPQKMICRIIIFWFAIQWKKCTPYNGGDFLKGEESSNVEDVSGGKTVFSFGYKKPVSTHYKSEVDVAFI